MKILLANDTANFSHIGCKAVSNAHACMLGEKGHEIKKRIFAGDINPQLFKKEKDKLNQYLDNLFEDIDALVVNSEGSIHHNNNIIYLELLDQAQQRGLKTLLINAVLQEIDGFENIFLRLDCLSVRDINSQNYMRNKGIECLLRPDSFIEAEFSKKPLLDLNAITTFTCWHPHRIDSGKSIMDIYKSLPESMRFFIPIHSEAAEDWQSIPETIGTSKMLITGRHHGVYCALITATPFIAFESNTWKIDGLKGLCPSIREYLCPDNPLAAIKSAISCSENFVEARNNLLEFRPLDIFAVLGKGDLSDKEEGRYRELNKLEDDISSLKKRIPNIDLALRLKGRNLEINQAAL